MLNLSHVSKTYNRGTVNEKQALSNLELTLEEGDFVTVIGGNGAGKSTMLNVIAGVFYSDRGTITLEGEDITRQPEYKRARYLGRVFQDPMMGTAAGMTIEENLSMANRRGKHRGLRWGSGRKERADYREALSSLGLGLETRMETKVGLLSGGQRQALTLLMATMQRPKVLLLDEHTAALDPATAHRVLELTRQMVEGGKLTTIMVTHNMHDAIEFGNRLVMMHEGKVALDISGEEKKKLTVESLLSRFQMASGEKISNDRMLLS